MDNQQQNPSNPVKGNGNWERETIDKLLFTAVDEQKKARRWSVFFKSLMFAYLIGLLLVAVYPKFKDDVGGGSGDHTAVIDLVGMIAEDQAANADSIIHSLREAVKDKHTKGIILHANSPGGSPVQSSYVYDEIKAIKKEHPNIPVYTVVSDICASGCYFIAAASDKIFVNPSSLIGSIGVIMDGFGFVDVMQKLGVERRLITAGDHKAMLDPFSPSKPEEKQFMQGLIDQVHRQFISAVKNGRGKKLKETPDMFSGLVWTGEESVKNGIADAVGTQDTVAKAIGAEKLVDFTEQTRLLDKLAGKLGAAFGQALGSAVKETHLR
jgi:protease IV